jgi:hypothetical protein
VRSAFAKFAGGCGAGAAGFAAQANTTTPTAPIAAAQPGRSAQLGAIPGMLDGLEPRRERDVLEPFLVDARQEPPEKAPALDQPRNDPRITPPCRW